MEGRRLELQSVNQIMSIECMSEEWIGMASPVTVVALYCLGTLQLKEDSLTVFCLQSIPTKSMQSNPNPNGFPPEPLKAQARE